MAQILKIPLMNNKTKTQKQMKKQIIALSLGLVSFVAIAQKKELKNAEKAIKAKDITSALSILQSLEGSISEADDKYKTKYYFLKGKALYTQNKFEDVVTTFGKLKDLENKIGKKKYTPEADLMYRKMIAQVSERANDLYQNKKDYKAASKDFYLTYKLSPKDTVFAYYSAVSATQAKDYDTALVRYKELQKLGYTGVQTQYLATNKATGKSENLGSKAQRDLMVKSGQYEKPEDKTADSKTGLIVKNIALILKEQGKTDEAIAAISQARKINPKDESLIFAAAEIYQKLNKMDEFGKLMADAIALRPNDPVLYYNLAVVTSKTDIEKAKEYYRKAIELKPDYSDAYVNLAASILDKEKSIIDKMNALPPSKMKAYDALEKERKGLYKEALPYLEKADKLNRNEATVKTLKSIYENLEMNSKAKEYKNLLQSYK